MSNTNKTENKAGKKAEKKVKIKLPITRTEKEPVYVAMNGHPYLIKRGIEVEVPAGVAEIIKLSDDMLAAAMAYEESAGDTNEE